MKKHGNIKKRSCEERQKQNPHGFGDWFLSLLINCTYPIHENDDMLYLDLETMH